MKRTNKRWTPADLELLRQGVLDGRSDAELAQVLGSTEGTVANYRRKLLGLHRGADECLYCEAPLVHPAVGRRKFYCDPLCREAALSEAEREATLARRLDRMCARCGGELSPSRNGSSKYCSLTCNKAAWHEAVMADPARKARRRRMLYAAARARKARA